MDERAEQQRAAARDDPRGERDGMGGAEPSIEEMARRLNGAMRLAVLISAAFENEPPESVPGQLAAVGVDPGEAGTFVSTVCEEVEEGTRAVMMRALASGDASRVRKVMRIPALAVFAHGVALGRALERREQDVA